MQRPNDKSDEELIVNYIISTYNASPAFCSTMYSLGARESAIKDYFSDNPTEESYQKLCAHIEAEMKKTSKDKLYQAIQRDVDQFRPKNFKITPNL